MESRFKFSIDEERPDTLLKTKRESQRTDKLSRRLTFMVVLLLMLWAGTIAAGYFFIYQKFNTSQEENQKNIELLTQDLESKFSVLSKQTATMEGTVSNLSRSVNTKGYPDDLMVELEKIASSLREQISELEKSVTLLKDSKLDKQEFTIELEKSLEPKMTALKQSFSELKSDSSDMKKIETAVNNLEASIKSLDEKFARELVKLAEKIH